MKSIIKKKIVEDDDSDSNIENENVQNDIKSYKNTFIIDSDSDIDSDTESELNSIEPNDNTLNNLDNEYITCENIPSNDVDLINCTNLNTLQSCNNLLQKKENLERKCLNQSTPENDLFLYPSLSDENFNLKISKKKEFNDYQYNGTIDLKKTIKEQANILSNAEFELQPHQIFVKNFVSSQTPYNSLYINHGLGTGKTCTAIGVCEETREYLKQTNNSKRIIIVASKNVQDNFKLQLFDERKLEIVDGNWNIQSCTGNNFIKEINPTNMKNIPKEKIISQVKQIINNSYIFLGYGQFANYIIKTIGRESVDNDDVITKTKQPILQHDLKLNKSMVSRLKNEFNERLIVIDEIHNIRITDDDDKKKVADVLQKLVENTDTLKFLFLSATPMYNSYKEIIWILNLMNINDNRSTIKISDVFDNKGNIKPSGKQLLIQKATGYISFVKGENPFTFPYRVYPSIFDKKNTFDTIKYPSYQMNNKHTKITNLSNNILGLYVNRIKNCNKCNNCQMCAYKYIIDFLKNKDNNFNNITNDINKKQNLKFDQLDSFNYTVLQILVESLIISYPHDNLSNSINNIKYDNTKDNPSNNAVLINPKTLTGQSGLNRMVTYTENDVIKNNFEYDSNIENKYGRIFSYSHIKKYSSKIKNVIDNIYNQSTDTISDGIILIYSQYIDGGLIPMALALEEMGFNKYTNGKESSLFKNEPPNIIPTLKKANMKYTMITGDIKLSPNNNADVNYITTINNKNGDKIKVVLISKTGAEGIDFKYIRQVHILDPWYNTNRLEQIIGRAVRNLSHKDLDFEKRNVQIFIHAILLDDGNDQETADLYIYRTAEQKALQIGNVTRLLKETAVDCILNHNQTNFTQHNMNSLISENITQILSNKTIINDFKIGDAPFSALCDYKENCYYNCNPNTDNKNSDINNDTYNEKYILVNIEKIIQKIKLLFKIAFFYKKDILIKLIRVSREYPYSQIYYALSQMLDNNENIIDKYNRPGSIINIGEYYLFQPEEITDKNLSIFDRAVPVDYKHNSIIFDLEQQPQKNNKTDIIEDTDISFIESLKEMYATSLQYMDKLKVEKKDDNWYKYYGIIMKKINNNFNNIKIFEQILNNRNINIKHFLIDILFEHLIETLLINEKLKLMNYINSVQTIELNSFEYFSDKYFKNNIKLFDNNDILYKYIGFYDDNEYTFLQFDETNNTWVKMQLLNQQKTKEYIEVNSLPKTFNKTVGLIGLNKTKKYLVFKTKQYTTQKKFTGARCDESGKIKTINLINTILNENRFTKTSDVINNFELCVLQETILRFFNKIKHNDNHWFLTI